MQIKLPLTNLKPLFKTISMLEVDPVTPPMIVVVISMLLFAQFEVVAALIRWSVKYSGSKSVILIFGTEKGILLPLDIEPQELFAAANTLNELFGAKLQLVCISKRTPICLSELFPAALMVPNKPVDNG